MKGTEKEDILLIMCPPWDEKKPPLGLAYLSTYLRSKGLKTKVMDINIMFFNEVLGKDKELWYMENIWNISDPEYVEQAYMRFKPYIDEYAKKIIKTNIKTLGFSINPANFNFTKWLIQSIKSHKDDYVIIMGGPLCEVKIARIETPVDCCDYFVIGEGEQTLYELLKAIRDKTDVESIPGVEVNKIQITKHIKGISKKKTYSPRQLLDINSIPHPTFEEFTIEDYTNDTLPLLTSRGCIGNCSFCTDHILAGPLRVRNPEKVVKEIKYLIEKYSINTFTLHDLLCNGDLKNLGKLCDLLIEENLEIEWDSYAMIRRDMGLDFLKKLKQSGCASLNYGFESGSDNVLKGMRKFYNSDNAKQVLQDTKKAGIDISINIITGFPGETEDNHIETMEFLKENKDHIDVVSNVSTCFVMDTSDLMVNRNKYQIKIGHDLSCWRGPHGNDYDVRKRRADEILDLLRELQIPVIIKNIPDEFREKPDIMLVNCPPWGVNNPPVGIAYLASYLRVKNIKVEILDFNIYLYNDISDEFKNLWHVENKNYWSNELTFNLLRDIFNDYIGECSDKIAKSYANIIGFSVVDPKEKITIEVIRRVKELNPKKIIILGGPATSTNESREIFTEKIPNLIDAFVIGEGEETLYDLICAINSSKPLEKISGALVLKNGKCQDLNPRPQIKDIDSVQFPTYEEFYLRDYSGGKTLILEWSRGCIGNCSFCKGKALLGGYRSRSPENILEELRYHVEKNQVRNFTICDSLINGDLKNLDAVCEAIIDSDLEITWCAQAIPRGEMSLKLLEKMKMAGCYELQLGIESGSDTVLSSMRKMFTSKEAEKVLRRVHETGIHTALFIIIGFPGESEDEFKKTVDFIKRNADYIDTIKSINSLHIISGTELHSNPDTYGIVLPDKNEHCEWYSKKGDNDLNLRNDRIKRLMDMLPSFGIKLRETNLGEGKESKFSSDAGSTRDKLRIHIDQLQDLSPKSERLGKISENKSPVVLFSECLTQHGLSYTLKRTAIYIKNAI